MTEARRIASIDQFRGFAIVLMVVANYLGGVNGVPSYLKHAPDIGLTVVDLIAPFFIFAIGLTYRISFERRATSGGLGAAYTHFATRFLAIAGIGAVFAAGEDIISGQGGQISWGALQAIGAAGIVCLVVIRLGTLPRLAIGAALLAGYQILLDRYFLADVLGSHHGGLPGSLGWGGMLVLSTVMADLYHDRTGAMWRGKRTYGIASALFLAAGLASAEFAPISKNRVSASYVLVSLAASALLFRVFDYLSGSLGRRMPALVWWGTNPLFLYVLHEILLGVFLLPGIPALYSEASAPVACLEIAFLLGTLTLVARIFFRRRIIIKI